MKDITSTCQYFVPVRLVSNIPDELILIVFDGDRKEFNVGYWHCDLGSIVPEAA